MSRNNIFLLALALVYTIIAVMQIFSGKLFENQFYQSIVFISFIVTSAELIRSLTKALIQYNESFNDIRKSEIEICQKHIDVFQEHNCLENEITCFREVVDKKNLLSKGSDNKNSIDFLSNFDIIIFFIEALLVFAVILIFPLFNPPDSLNNRIVLNFASLLTLSFAFISIYCNDYIAEDLKQSKEKIEYETKHSNYYLDIIKRISVYQKNNNANEDKEFNDNEK